MPEESKHRPRKIIEVRAKLNPSILLFCVSLILMLFFAEIVFRAYYGLNGEAVGVSEYERCSRMAYRKAANEDRLQRFMPGDTVYLEYSQYSGVRPKANWRGNSVRNITLKDGTRGRQVTYGSNTNSQHMRALKDYSPAKDPDKLRVAVFGDSFTWGANVPLKFSYTHLLEELVNDSEVLNFGVEATGIGVMYLRWKNEALNFRPDVVVFGIHIDDVARIQHCIHKPKFEVEDGRLKITNFPPPSYETLAAQYKEPKIESYFLKHLIYNIRYFGGVDRKKYEHGFRVLDVMLDEIKEKSRADGTHFMVLVIPAGNDQENTETQLASIKKLEEMLDEKQIPYINSNDVFARENYTRTDDTGTDLFKHFTPEGYALIAQGLKDKLEDDGVIPETTDYLFRWDRERNILFLADKEGGCDIRGIAAYDIILPAPTRNESKRE